MDVCQNEMRRQFDQDSCRAETHWPHGMWEVKLKPSPTHRKHHGHLPLLHCCEAYHGDPRAAYYCSDGTLLGGGLLDHPKTLHTYG